MKPFKNGAIYELRPEYLDKLYFSSDVRAYCQAKYGEEKHVISGKCTNVTPGGSCTLILDNTSGDPSFFVASYERHMFRRMDNK